MALTKIKLDSFVSGNLPDANIPNDITIDTASAVPASGLTGNTLASGVTASSLTSVGTLSSLNVSGNGEFNGTVMVSGTSDSPLSLRNTSGGEMFLKFLNTNGTINGAIISNSNSNTMAFRAGGNTFLSIDGSSNSTFTGNVTIDGATHPILKLVGDSSGESTHIQLHRSNGHGFTIYDTGAALAFRSDTSSNDQILQLANSDQSARFYGNVGIGGSPSEKLQITETTHGSNVSMRFLAENDSGTLKEGNIRFDPDGENLLIVAGSGTDPDISVTASGRRVGIGIAAPTSKLHVYNAGVNEQPVRIQGSSSTETFDLGITGVASPAHYSVAFKSQEAANSGMAFYTRDSGGTVNERMVIQGDGNVGIGTDSPSNPLTVFREGAGTVAQFGPNNTAHDASIYLRSNGVFNFFTPGGGSIRFSSGGSTALTLDTSQNATFTEKILMTGESVIQQTADETKGFMFNGGGGTTFGYPNVQGSGLYGMVFGRESILAAGGGHYIAKSHWGGISIIGFSGSGVQGIDIVAWGYGNGGATVLKSGNWVGSLYRSYSTVNYHLVVDVGTNVTMFSILIGI